MTDQYSGLLTWDEVEGPEEAADLIGSRYSTDELQEIVRYLQQEIEARQAQRRQARSARFCELLAERQAA